MVRGARARPLALWLVILCCAAGCDSDLVVLKAGDVAPVFVLDDVDGGRLALGDLRGKVVMVRFWADWCKSCRTEMPMIEEKYQQWRDADLVVLALNVRQSRELAAKFAKDVGISYPVLLDRDGSVAKAYGVLGLPSTFLLDRQGRVREEIIGDMNRKSLGALLDPLFQTEARP